MDLSLLLLLLLSRLRLLFLSLSFLVRPLLLLSIVAMPRQAGEERTKIMVSFAFAFEQTAVRLGANLTPTGRQVDEAGGPDQGGKEGGRGDEVLDR